jgi:hypothetical protein
MQDNPTGNTAPNLNPFSTNPSDPINPVGTNVPDQTAAAPPANTNQSSMTMSAHEPSPFIPLTTTDAVPSDQIPNTTNSTVPVNSKVPTPYPISSQPNDKVLSPVPPVNQTTDNTPPSVVTSDHVPKKYGGGKVIATIFGVLLIAGAVAAGVGLVQNQVFKTSRAWDCSTYNFTMSQTGDVQVINGSTYNETPQHALVSINDAQVADLSVPAVARGSSANLGHVDVPSSGTFSWRVVGTVDCEDSGSYQATHKINICHVPPGDVANSQSVEVDQNAWETGHDEHNSHSLDYLIDGDHPCPPVIATLTPTPEPEATATPIPSVTSEFSPTPGETASAECSDVIVYDTNWDQLDVQSLSQLEAGQTVYLTVSGTSSSGSFDKARFTVNGVIRPETTTKKPGTANTFYDDYSIPSGTTTFTINAQIHHTILGWF